MRNYNSNHTLEWTPIRAELLWVRHLYFADVSLVPGCRWSRMDSASFNEPPVVEDRSAWAHGSYKPQHDVAREGAVVVTMDQWWNLG